MDAAKGCKLEAEAVEHLTASGLQHEKIRTTIGLDAWLLSEITDKLGFRLRNSA